MITHDMKLMLIACPSGKIQKAAAHDGAPTIRLLASGTKRDQTGDRIADQLLDSMLEQAKAGTVMLLENHHSSFPMGHSFDGQIISTPEGRELYIDFWMDTAHPLTNMIIGQVDHGYEAQCSIGLNKKPVTEVRYDPEQGGPTRYLMSGNFEHVAFTRPQDAAYPDATIEEMKVMKSLSEAVRVFKHVGGSMLIPSVGGVEKGGAGSGRYPAGSGKEPSSGSGSGKHEYQHNFPKEDPSIQSDHTPAERAERQEAYASRLSQEADRLGSDRPQSEHAEANRRAMLASSHAQTLHENANRPKAAIRAFDRMDRHDREWRRANGGTEPPHKSLTKSLIPTVAQKGGAGSGRYPAGSGGNKKADTASVTANAATAIAQKSGRAKDHEAAAQAHWAAADAHSMAGDDRHYPEHNRERLADYHMAAAREHEKKAESSRKSITKSASQNGCGGVRLIPNVAKGGPGSGRYPAGSGGDKSRAADKLSDVAAGKSNAAFNNVGTHHSAMAAHAAAADAHLSAAKDPSHSMATRNYHISQAREHENAADDHAEVGRNAGRR